MGRAQPYFERTTKRNPSEFVRLRNAGKSNLCLFCARSYEWRHLLGVLSVKCFPPRCCAVIVKFVNVSLLNRAVPVVIASQSLYHCSLIPEGASLSLSLPIFFFL